MGVSRLLPPPFAGSARKVAMVVGCGTRLTLGACESVPVLMFQRSVPHEPPALGLPGPGQVMAPPLEPPPLLLPEPLPEPTPELLPEPPPEPPPELLPEPPPEPLPELPPELLALASVVPPEPEPLPAPASSNPNGCGLSLEPQPKPTTNMRRRAPPATARCSHRVPA